MTTPEALNALADRVEREEPHALLDAAIHAVVHGAMDLQDDLPAYTTSLDAAVTLVPEDASVNLGSAIMADGAVWRAVVAGGMACWAKTPAAALTAAALRARASLTEEE